tara:strand:+ start:894 stop:1496 length:603 start_codon:yes stop_codon:yes gene_type:complete
MSRKTFVQCFFILLIFLTLGVFKYFYQNDEKLDVVASPKISINENENENENRNSIEKIEYSTTDREGNSYNITSKSGELDLANAEIITMLDVNAKIILTDRGLITIEADFAKYNSTNYNTNFFNNVLLKFEDHNINSDKLDFFFDKNQILMSDNIIYKSSMTEMNADILEIDLITKNFRLLMYNESDNIKIIGQLNNGIN